MDEDAEGRAIAGGGSGGGGGGARLARASTMQSRVGGGSGGIGGGRRGRRQAKQEEEEEDDRGATGEMGTGEGVGGAAGGKVGSSGKERSECFFFRVVLPCRLFVVLILCCVLYRGFSSQFYWCCGCVGCDSSFRNLRLCGCRRFPTRLAEFPVVFSEMAGRQIGLRGRSIASDHMSRYGLPLSRCCWLFTP